jgi:hypothetical protein
MPTQKRLLSLEELEVQMLVMLPDRELMHVYKHGSHAGGRATITETTTQTVNNCTNSTGVQFSCNTVGSVDGSSNLTPVHSSHAGGRATITETTTQTVNNCTNSTGVQFSCNTGNVW